MGFCLLGAATRWSMFKCSGFNLSYMYFGFISSCIWLPVQRAFRPYRFGLYSAFAWSVVFVPFTFGAFAFIVHSPFVAAATSLTQGMPFWQRTTTLLPHQKIRVLIYEKTPHRDGAFPQASFDRAAIPQEAQGAID